MSLGTPIKELIGQTVASAIEVPEWLRGPATVDGDDLVLDAKRAERYQTAPGVEGLLFELAALREPHDALGFIRRYGMLWAGPDADEHRESFGDWLRQALVLTWVLRTQLDLIDAIEGDLEARERLRRDEHIPHFFERPPESLDELLRCASHVVASHVSGGMEGTEERVIADVDFVDGLPGHYSFLARPKSLVGYAYYELALLVVNRYPAAACPVCGRFFAVEHGRQRFCSPRCANRARARRFSEKRKSSASRASA